MAARLMKGGALILDAGAMLGVAPNRGPVFKVNEAGEVAFRASDGSGPTGVYVLP